MARAFRTPNVFLIGAYAVIVGIFAVPLLEVFSLSLKTLREAYAYPPTLIPLRPTIDNYIAVWTTTPVVRYFSNSIIIVLVAVLGSLAVSIPFAYALSRFHFRAKPLALLSLLVVRMISPVIIIVPLYRYYAALGLLDSLAGVAAVYVATQAPVATWVLKGFFDTIPADLDNAALIDGCSRLQALVRVVLPVSLPGIAAAVIFDAIFGWSQFLIPFVLLTDSKRFPISVVILTFQSTAESISIHLLAAASIIAILPVVVVFVLLQRYIVYALTAGAVKR